MSGNCRAGNGNKTSLSWDGKNEHGNMVGRIYEVRVSVGQYTDVGKLIVE